MWRGRHGLNRTLIIVGLIHGYACRILGLPIFMSCSYRLRPRPKTNRPICSNATKFLNLVFFSCIFPHHFQLNATKFFNLTFFSCTFLEKCVFRCRELHSGVLKIPKMQLFFSFLAILVASRILKRPKMQLKYANITILVAFLIFERSIRLWVASQWTETAKEHRDAPPNATSEHRLETGPRRSSLF